MWFFLTVIWRCVGGPGFSQQKNHMPALTSSERSELIRSEKLLQDWERWFVQAGSALRNIRDSKLYREDHETFEDYCKTRWGWTKQRAYQLIDAVEVVESFPKKLSESVVNEGQARALSQVPEEMRKEVFQKVIKSGDVTASAITDAASQKSTIVDSKTSVKSGKSEKAISKNGDSEKIIELDKIGRVIPDGVLELWHRSEEAQNLISSISRIKGVLVAAQEDNDPLFLEVNYSDAISALDRAYAQIKRAKPHAVCTTCQGRLTKTCSLCKGRGFLSQFAYMTFVPADMRAIVEKGAKK